MSSIPPQPRKVFRLSAITSRIRDLLLEASAKQFWIQAHFEIDKKGAGGHVYGNLVEIDGRGKTVAKIRAMIWSSDYEQIERKLQAAGMTDGLRDSREICALCSVRFHEVHGLSLSIFDVDPHLGESHVERNRRVVLERLQRDDLLKRNKSVSLTAVPLRIGLITADGSAAMADFRQTLVRSPFGFQIFLAPAAMQGDATARSVVAAVNRLLTLKVDLICIVRGGGSPVDLAWLDDESIARAVAQCPIPVWVGIGHEIDHGVLDFIAHQSHKTPTEVAKVLVDRLLVLATRLESAGERLRDVCERRTALAAQHIERLGNGLIQGTRKHSEIHTEQFLGSVSKLQERSRRILAQASLTLSHGQAALLASTTLRVRLAAEALERDRSGLVAGTRKHQTLLHERHRRRLDALAGSVQRIVSRRFSLIATSSARLSERVRATLERGSVRSSRSQQRLESLTRAQLIAAERELRWKLKGFKAAPRLLARQEQILEEKAKRRDALDPERLLDRGYSLTRDSNGNLITSVQELVPGLTIHTQVRDGIISSTVDTVKEVLDGR